MQYFSLNRKSDPVSFREAAVRGQAADGGLYFPASLPRMDPAWITNPDTWSNEQIAFEVLKPFVAQELPDAILEHIVTDTFNFPIPLVPVNGRMSALELFYGPTLAFKDVGARFMSRCLGYFSRGENRKVTVLVATSGDTGSAVAHGFHGVAGVEVVILYPSGKVSRVQEQQLTTLGDNIRTLEVHGTFDDCQQMVKQAFSDVELNQKLFLTSANSINVARWLPQQVYYFFAWKLWADKKQPPVVSVPSGNFGNIGAGLLACAAGLPFKGMIAACNANDVVDRYWKTRVFEPKPAIPTISNAMDVGNPSNFIRMQELFQRIPELAESFFTGSVSDDQTKRVMRRVFENHGYILDPHGAVGFLALEEWLETHSGVSGIFLETAHPVKFYDVVEPILEHRLDFPEAVQAVMKLEKQSTRIPASYEALRAFLETAG